MTKYYSRRDLYDAGVTTYSRQHLARLVREGKLSKPLQRAPGCRHIYTEEHKAELLGLAKKPEVLSS